MKVIVTGSKNFEDYELLSRTLKKLFKKLDNKKTKVITGGAIGTDRMAIKWALANFYTVMNFYPDYKEYEAKIAILKRNKEMVDFVGSKGRLLAFHLKNSPGTRLIIEMAKKKGMKVKVIDI